MSASDQTKRYYGPDAIRGLCAVAILFYHVNLWNAVDFYQVGYFGVYVFFLLSGFSLWHVYAHRPLSAEGLRAFFVARLARIAPLYLFVVGLGVLARLYAQGADAVFSWAFASRFALNVSMLFGLHNPGKTSVVPGGWSIGIEWVFYLSFPLFLFFARRLSAMFALFAASLALNQVIVADIIAHSTIGESYQAYTNFPTFLVYFTGGMLVAQYHAKARAKGWTPPAYLPQPLLRLLPLLIIAVTFQYPSMSPEDYLSGFDFAVMVLALMFGIFLSLWVLPTAFEKRLYSFLGNISYSAYLLHFFVYSALDALGVKAGLAHSLPWLLSGTLVITLPLAHAMYLFFESPARAFVNRRLAPKEEA